MLAFPMQDADGWTPASRRPVPLPANDHACLYLLGAYASRGGSAGAEVGKKNPWGQGSPREVDVTIIC